MNYLDFQIRAWLFDERHAQVIVHSSPVGAMRKPVKVPLDISELDEIRRTADKQWLGKPGTHRRIIEAGQQLANILLPPQVYTLLARSLDRIGPENGLRLRLCLDGALIDLPWELLYRPDASEPDPLDDFLILSPRISLVREAPVASDGLQPSAQQQRMVIVGALTIAGSDPWQVKEERRQLIEALKPVQELLRIDESFDASSGDQIEQALGEPAAIFHYSGHVGVEGDRGYLVREIKTPDLTSGCDSSDFDRLYSDEKLGRRLRKAGTRLAVFSACNSGRWAFVKPLLEAGLPALIGIQGSTWNEAAIAFCQKLYSALAVGLSLDEAVIHARLHIFETNVSLGSESCEWGAFIVYMPTSDAILLRKPEQQPGVLEKQEAERKSLNRLLNKGALRKAILKAFDEEDLDVLCSDIEQELANDGKEFEVDLETAGGKKKEAKVHNLIEYLDRRSVLPYLINAVRKARPDIAI